MVMRFLLPTYSYRANPLDHTLLLTLTPTTWGTSETGAMQLNVLTDKKRAGEDKVPNKQLR
eukprot:842972-Rhodomonas_salina.1